MSQHWQRLPRLILQRLLKGSHLERGRPNGSETSVLKAKTAVDLNHQDCASRLEKKGITSALRGPDALCACSCRKWIWPLCLLSCVVDLAFLAWRRRLQERDLENSNQTVHACHTIHSEYTLTFSHSTLCILAKSTCLFDAIVWPTSCHHLCKKRSAIIRNHGDHLRPLSGFIICRSSTSVTYFASSTSSVLGFRLTRAFTNRM